jgi:RNA polymerase sigma factor (sigma-70 family)
MESVEHVFRRESGRMVATLTRIFGVHNLQLAEDVVQDAFCRALEVWKFRGMPENPSAWLMATAKNRAVDMLRRERTARTFAPELDRFLKSEWTLAPTVHEQFQPHAIKDDQLRMMFSCCHPRLSTEAQVTLILKTLCGFSVSEIAHALLTKEDAIEKRLGRTRKVLRESGTFTDLTMDSDIPKRLEAVDQAIYLLFNEGYHGSHSERTVREDLCSEAIRLALLLSKHPQGDKPKTHALIALLSFHAARLPGRLDDHGALLQLEMQDRANWDQDLVEKGFHHLDKSSTGTELSTYHLEAAIAALHCSAKSFEKTDWAEILKLYDSLYQLKPSPIVALNRAIAVGKAQGPEEGLLELSRIPYSARLQDYPFYPAAQGEFHRLAGHKADAARHFAKALRLARNKAESSFFRAKATGLSAKCRSQVKFKGFAGA